VDKISVVAIYADERTSQSGIHSLEETLNVFRKFPWSSEQEKSHTTKITPMISLVARGNTDSYLNIVMNDEGLFHIKIEITVNSGVFNTGFFNSLFQTDEKVDFFLSEKSEVVEYIKDFFQLPQKELLKKLK
jgi:hypothetical protein